MVKWREILRGEIQDQAGPNPKAEPAISPRPEPRPNDDDKWIDSKPIEPKSMPGRLRWVNILVVLVLIGLALYMPVLQAMGRYLVFREPETKADIIVVLAGSPVVRSLAAADSYNRGLAPIVFVCRGNLERADLVADIDLSDTGNWSLMYRILTARGVKEGDLVKDSAFVKNTLEEARRVRKYAAENDIRSLILVTSKYHSRRAHQIFTRQLGEDIDVISLPSKYDPFDPEQWWRDRHSAKMVLLEYQKIVFSWFEGD